MSGQGGVIGSSPSPPIAAPRTLAPSCIVRPWTADHAGHAGSRVDLGVLRAGGRSSRGARPDAAGLPVTVSETGPHELHSRRRPSMPARGHSRKRRAETTNPSASRSRGGVAPEEVPDQVRSRLSAKTAHPHPTRAGQVAQGGARGGQRKRFREPLPTRAREVRGRCAGRCWRGRGSRGRPPCGRGKGAPRPERGRGKG